MAPLRDPLILALAAAPLFSVLGLVLAVVAAGGDPEVPGEVAPDEVLVCGHGSRDRCCGGSGTRLAVEARAAPEAVRAAPGSRRRPGPSGWTRAWIPPRSPGTRRLRIA